MRRRFLITIVGENDAAPVPKDLVDFLDFDVDGGIRPETGKPRPVIRIKFCPFCGKPVTGPMRIAQHRVDEEGEEWKKGKPPEEG